MTPADLLNRFMLALCVWREARGESKRGKLLVASVVRNRSEDVRWPGTYAGVVTQPKQFSCFNADDANALLFPKQNDPSWIESVNAANTIMDDGVLTSANHYCVNTLRPDWYDARKITETEGNHVFLRL